MKAIKSHLSNQSFHQLKYLKHPLHEHQLQ
jgi:hypothetical protein